MRDFEFLFSLDTKEDNNIAIPKTKNIKIDSFTKSENSDNYVSRLDFAYRQNMNGIKDGIVEYGNQVLPSIMSEVFSRRNLILMQVGGKIYRDTPKVNYTLLYARRTIKVRENQKLFPIKNDNDNRLYEFVPENIYMQSMGDNATIYYVFKKMKLKKDKIVLKKPTTVQMSDKYTFTTNDPYEIANNIMKAVTDETIGSYRAQHYIAAALSLDEISLVGANNSSDDSYRYSQHYCSSNYELRIQAEYNGETKSKLKELLEYISCVSELLNRLTWPHTQRFEPDKSVTSKIASWANTTEKMKNMLLLLRLKETFFNGWISDNLSYSDELRITKYKTSELNLNIVFYADASEPTKEIRESILELPTKSKEHTTKYDVRNYITDITDRSTMLVTSCASGALHSCCSKYELRSELKGRGVLRPKESSYICNRNYIQTHIENYTGSKIAVLTLGKKITNRRLNVNMKIVDINNIKDIEEINKDSLLASSIIANGNNSTLLIKTDIVNTYEMSYRNALSISLDVPSNLYYGTGQLISKYTGRNIIVPYLLANISCIPHGLRTISPLEKTMRLHKNDNNNDYGYHMAKSLVINSWNGNNSDVATTFISNIQSNKANILERRLESSRKAATRLGDKKNLDDTITHIIELSVSPNTKYIILRSNSSNAIKILASALSSEANSYSTPITFGEFTSIYISPYSIGKLLSNKQCSSLEEYITGIMRVDLTIVYKSEEAWKYINKTVLKNYIRESSRISRQYEGLPTSEILYNKIKSALSKGKNVTTIVLGSSKPVNVLYVHNNKQIDVILGSTTNYYNNSIEINVPSNSNGLLNNNISLPSLTLDLEPGENTTSRTGILAIKTNDLQNTNAMHIKKIGSIHIIYQGNEENRDRDLERIEFTILRTKPNRWTSARMTEFLDIDEERRSSKDIHSYTTMTLLNAQNKRLDKTVAVTDILVDGKSIIGDKWQCEGINDNVSTMMGQQYYEAKRIADDINELWESQRDDIAVITSKKNIIVASEMGTGKTRLMIGSAIASRSKSVLFITKKGFIPQFIDEFKKMKLDKPKHIETFGDIENSRQYNIMSYEMLLSRRSNPEDSIRKFAIRKDIVNIAELYLQTKKYNISTKAVRESKKESLDILRDKVLKEYSPSQISSIALELNGIYNKLEKITIAKIIKKKFSMICFDEAHYILNRNTPMGLSSSTLNAKRKVLVTGTPITKGHRDLAYFHNLYVRKSGSLQLGFGKIDAALHIENAGHIFMNSRRKMHVYTSGISSNRIEMTSGIVENVLEYSIGKRIEDSVKYLIVKHDKSKANTNSVRFSYSTKQIETIKSDIGKITSNFYHLRDMLVLRRVSREKDMRNKVASSYTNKTVWIRPSQEHMSKYVEEIGGFKKWLDNETIDRLEKQVSTTKLRSKLNHLRHCSFDPDRFSRKQEAIIEIVNKHVSSGEKIIIFFEYKLHASKINRLLDSNGVRSINTINCSPVKRATEIMRFKQDESINALIITNRTGSHAYDIPEANIVIFAETPWHYYIKDQAFHRVLRPGQDKDVIIYSFLNKGMVDEHIFTTVENRKIIGSNVLERTSHVMLESTTYTEVTKKLLDSMKDAGEFSGDETEEINVEKVTINDDGSVVTTKVDDTGTVITTRINNTDTVESIMLEDNKNDTIMI